MKCLLLVLLVFQVGCAGSPPSNLENLCTIFKDKNGWYGDANKARKQWGSPISVMMAIMHQESRFVANAKPPRKKIFGFIPGARPSDAYGYPQAKKSTWKEYTRNAGKYGADRDDYGDAMDFIGWYNHQSNRRNGIAKTDAYRLYLAYHEGQGGYSRGSYNAKQWLINVARKVELRAGTYRQQLLGCEAKLDKGGWFSSWF